MPRKNFVDALSRRPSYFRCIQQVINGVNSCGIYGIIRHFCHETKELRVEDPTALIDITLEADCDFTNFYQGNIIRISSLNHEISSGETSCRIEDCKIYPSFSHDYDQLNDYFDSNYERNICQILERWESDNLLRGWNVSLLPAEGKVFVNLVCQVVRLEGTKDGIHLLVWDGHHPNGTVDSVILPEDSYPSLNGVACREGRLWEQFRSNNDPQLIYPLTVWCYKEGLDHYKKILKVEDPDCLLVFYNLEVDIESAVTICFRGDMNKHSALHVVNPDSILGKVKLDELENLIPEHPNPKFTSLDFRDYVIDESYCDE